MKIKHIHQGVEYTLSNEDLKVGDKVFPISHGKVIGDKYTHHAFYFKVSMSGFPNEPHTILDLHYSKDKAYEIKTDMGYSPVECYFGIIDKIKA